MSNWDIEQTRETYNIAHWSGGYFDINSSGNLVARPDRNADSQGIDLFELSQTNRVW